VRTTVFNFELRVIACQVCGAPVEVGEAGGAKACSYCGSSQEPAARAQAVARSAAMPEPERLDRLRSQLGKPTRVPQPLADLFVGFRLLPWKVSEALGRWRRLLADAQRDPEVEGALERLTRALASHFGQEGDPMRERALLQAALEAVRTPRHRQSLLAALSRAACRVGDAAAAESWLRMCDPTSSNLEIDSVYRATRALVATYGQQHEEVLQVLGAGGEAPISDEYQVPCAVLLGNALERLGRVDEAVAVLDRGQSSSLARHRAREFVAEYSGIELCPMSGPAALARQAERGAALSSRAAGRPLIMLVFTLAVLAAGGITAAVLGATSTLGGTLMAGGITGLLVGALAPITVIEFLRSGRARRLRRSGRPEIATVVHARYGGQETMGVPQLLYKLMVFPAGRSPFYANSALHADKPTRERLARGAVVVVRMDPERLGDVLLELD
jgi:hypothetical protein